MWLRNALVYSPRWFYVALKATLRRVSHILSATQLSNAKASVTLIRCNVMLRANNKMMPRKCLS